MTLRCASCGEYLGRGTKFNARKEDAAGSATWAASRCPRCSAEIAFKTDPGNSDYAVESGAAPRATTGFGDAMAALEARARAGRREMDADADTALEEARSLSARRARVAPEQALESLHNRCRAADGCEALRELEQEADEDQGESNTELVEYSHMAERSPDNQVYMASLRNADDDEPGPENDAELLADVFADERTMDAPQDKNEEYRRIPRLKNAKRAKRRQNAKNRARNPLYQRNLNNAFAAAEDREYSTPIGTIAEAVLLAQQLPPNPQIQRLQYITQRACATRWATPNVLNLEHALET
ncbi:hypothetical protein C2845_PM08G17390 [Panicum miliaceum]|uniref:Uncharacterized protein n=1 Tax=Panicum miliaceum TaxID=4540 RepID=A0A3L6R1Q6_PANMI|nr:hypothetical protein C2845_PM08G17390 [Panicum miliaceum]